MTMIIQSTFAHSSSFVRLFSLIDSVCCDNNAASDWSPPFSHAYAIGELQVAINRAALSKNTTSAWHAFYNMWAGVYTTAGDGVRDVTPLRGAQILAQHSSIAPDFGLV